MSNRVTDKKTGQRVAHGVQGPGVHHVNSYLVSAFPWITGSSLAASTQHKISFPYVTKKVTVWYTGSVQNAEMRVHFAPDEASNKVIDGHHYITLNTVDDTYDFNVKCKEIYISRPADSLAAIEYKVVAELTHIRSSEMYALSGSGINAGQAVSGSGITVIT